MVDVLSFLLTPVGAVLRRTGKNSGLGCTDALYQSVENLSPTHFRTRACRHLLLLPRNAWCFHYKGLKLQINDAGEEVFYGCSSSSCFTIFHIRYISTVPDAKCVCSRDMTTIIPLVQPKKLNPDVVLIDSRLTNERMISSSPLKCPTSSGGSAWRPESETWPAFKNASSLSTLTRYNRLYTKSSQFVTFQRFFTSCLITFN